MKEDAIIIRTDEIFKEEFKLYFNNMSGAIIDLMENALEDKKKEIFLPLIEDLKGNRYVSAAIDAAICDINYYKKNGLSDREIQKKIKDLLVEKFDFSPSAAENFYNAVYKDVYKGNAEMLARHGARLAAFFKKETGGGADV